MLTVVNNDNTKSADCMAGPIKSAGNLRRQHVAVVVMMRIRKEVSSVCATAAYINILYNSILYNMCGTG